MPKKTTILISLTLLFCFCAGDCLAASSYYINAGTQKIGKVDENGDVFYFINDQVGSLRVITDDEGNEVETTDYAPFGEIYNEDILNYASTTFTGEEYDQGTGLFYYGARYYDHQLGRFISPDPKRQYSSPYVYVGNNPLNSIDPTGSWSWKIGHFGSYYKDPGFREWLASDEDLNQQVFVPGTARNWSRSFRFEYELGYYYDIYKEGTKGPETNWGKIGKFAGKLGGEAGSIALLALLRSGGTGRNPLDNISYDQLKGGFAPDLRFFAGKGSMSELQFGDTRHWTVGSMSCVRTYRSYYPEIPVLTGPTQVTLVKSPFVASLEFMRESEGESLSRVIVFNLNALTAIQQKHPDPQGIIAVISHYLIRTRVYMDPTSVGLSEAEQEAGEWLKKRDLIAPWGK